MMSSLSSISSRPRPVPMPRSARSQAARAAAVRPVRAAKINHDIKLDEPKVVDTIKVSDIDGKCVLCRCWQSKTFPMCDGSHVAHNKSQGDNVGPVIIDNSA